MGMFDNAKDKAGQLAGDNQEQVENVSDQGLDKAQDAAGGVGGGKFDDQIQQGRDAADGAVGQ